jgi:hypothetical protein
MSEGKSYQQLSVNGSLVGTKDLHLVQYLIIKYQHHCGIKFGFGINPLAPEFSFKF